PLKPISPADAQEITPPGVSEMESMVLLKVDVMWACPCVMFFLVRRPLRGAAPRAFAIECSPTISLDCLRLSKTGSTYFLRPATLFFGSLRVRALFLVRRPRAGRPRRLRIPL